MTTYNLPVTGLAGATDATGADYYIRFSAEKSAEGHWVFRHDHNLQTETDGLTYLKDVLALAIARHTDADFGQTSLYTYTFDAALLVLRQAEETILAHLGMDAGVEPKDHYMHAYRLLPDDMARRLDERYYRNNFGKNPLLPVKPRPPAGKRPPAAHIVVDRLVPLAVNPAYFKRRRS